MMMRPAAGQVYRWVGLPGQYETERLIRLDSTTATCAVNAAILDADNPDATPVDLVTIGISDLVAAITLGHLVHLPHLRKDPT